MVWVGDFFKNKELEQNLIYVYVNRRVDLILRCLREKVSFVYMLFLFMLEVFKVRSKILSRIFKVFE